MLKLSKYLTKPLYWPEIMQNIIPTIGSKVTKNKEAYKYLEESISKFPNQEILSSQLNQIGFNNISVINIFNGIVAIHKGFKIL